MRQRPEIEEASLRLAREIVLERLAEEKNPRDAKVLSSLAALLLLSIGTKPENASNTAPRSDEDSQTRSIVSRDEGDANEPVIINFERAKAEILARRAGRFASTRSRGSSAAPRLKIFRGE